MRGTLWNELVTVGPVGMYVLPVKRSGGEFVQQAAEESARRAWALAASGFGGLPVQRTRGGGA